MDEVVGAALAVLAMIVRFTWELIVQVVWETLCKGAIGLLIRLAWPGRPEAEAKNGEPGEGSRG